jgi:SAM-dependent methyltransferase
MDPCFQETLSARHSCNAHDSRQDHIINGIAWNNVADARDRAETTARPERDRFNWMQFRGCGPGQELFGPLDGRAVLEIGCGGGDSLAFLVRRGATGTGVDASERQVLRARSRWSEPLAGRVCFLHGDAAAVLVTLPAGSTDVTYSVFGAMGYADPRLLLPAVHRVLRARGRVLFALRHPLWPHPPEEPLDLLEPYSQWGRRLVELELTAGSRSTVVRYGFSVGGWTSVCREAGFEVDDVRELYVPVSALDRWYAGGQLAAMSETARQFPCTLLVCASKPA